QHLVALAHREVRALAELADETAQHRRRLGDEPRLGDARGEPEEPPAETVGERLAIALDEASFLERRQGARELALVAADALGERDVAEPVGCGRVRERPEHVEAARECCRSGVHVLTLTWSPSSAARRSTYSTSSSSIASSSGGCS